VHRQAFEAERCWAWGVPYDRVSALCWKNQQSKHEHALSRVGLDLGSHLLIMYATWPFSTIYSAMIVELYSGLSPAKVNAYKVAGICWNVMQTAEI
jgi:hypothetical protein